MRGAKLGITTVIETEFALILTRNDLKKKPTVHLHAVICERECVIAGARGNDAVFSLQFVQSRKSVASAALFERARRLHILHFEENIYAQRFRKLNRLLKA